jgi:uncharacterized OB-fold protein
MSDPYDLIKLLERKEQKMFRECKKCGYTAEPQDMWCSPCYRNKKEFNQMEMKVGK